MAGTTTSARRYSSIQGRLRERADQPDAIAEGVLRDPPPEIVARVAVFADDPRAPANAAAGQQRERLDEHVEALLADQPADAEHAQHRRPRGGERRSACRSRRASSALRPW